MPDHLPLATTALAFFVIAASPGPATLSNAAVAMRDGRQAGLVHGAGLSIGLAFWGVVAASGMGALMQGSSDLLMLLKMLGGLYLLWLAFDSGRTVWQRPTATAQQHDQRWFVAGLLLNLSNPKAVFAWMSALAVGLDANDNAAVVAVATVLCTVVGWISYVLYTLLFSIDGVMRAYRRFSRLVNGLVAGLFAAAGLALIRSAFSR